MIRTNFLFVLFWLFASKIYAQQQDGPRYFHIPMLEVMQNELYLKETEYNEVTVAFAGKGSDLHVGDYITHADGVKILSGGLTAFMKSGDKEAVIPIVDEDAAKHDGYKLMGFVRIELVTPRKVSTRRGEIVFDLDEGGVAPTIKLGNIVMGPNGAILTNDVAYQPPPYGGGPCITGKDCYFFNGTCVGGKCSCSGPYTGTYCQLNRPDYAAIGMMSKKQTEKLEASLQDKSADNRLNAKAFTQTRTQIPPQQVNNPKQTQIEYPEQVLKQNEPSKLTFDNNLSSATESQSASVENDSVNSEYSGRTEGAQTAQGNKTVKKVIKKKKPSVKPSSQQPTEENLSTENTKDAKPNEKVATIDDLYGVGKPYPEPITAGKPPYHVSQERHKRRFAREVFSYSVRFRSGPLGLVFDNKNPTATIVEKVTRGEQAEQSEIKVGDQLIAIDHYNVSTAPAKATSRIMQTLDWPRILVFETRYAGEDPNILKDKVKMRTFNMTILYPPTLVGEYSLRLSEWSATFLHTKATTSNKLSHLNTNNNNKPDFCPIYRIRAAQDPFGCEVEEDYFRLPEAFDTIADQNGFVNAEIEQVSQFLTLMQQEAFMRRMNIEPRSLSISKRGVCPFLTKARRAQANGASIALVVNNENELGDMPIGKEKTDDISIPVGMMKLQEADYIQLAARTNEIWAVITEQYVPGQAEFNEGSVYSRACERAITTAEDVIDKWPHSVPSLSVQIISQNRPPDQSRLRGLADEGGRVALSGQNGWAFFDYHLAMFGPQDVPLGPNRLVLAVPAFGCDPAAYTVRITGAVVAILRGGGCSFGIKVINAQKLGAKAVMIVNTDEMKTMRLMALPDEVPLINISCIMVSRRIQYYFEQLLESYFPIDQLLISFQPTGVFGDYEQKNTVQLPKRFSTQRLRWKNIHNQSMAKVVKNNEGYTPFTVTIIGGGILLAGATLLFVGSNQLFEAFDKTVVENAGILVIATAFVVLTISSFVNQAVYCSAGNLLLALSYSYQALVRFTRPSGDLALTEVAVNLLLTVGGIYILLDFYFAKFMLPVMYPMNYSLIGCLIFGVGAVANLTAVLINDQTIGSSLTVTSPFLLMTGAGVFLLGANRLYYCLDLLIIYNYPSVSVSVLSPLRTFLISWGLAVQTLLSLLYVGVQLTTVVDKAHGTVLLQCIASLYIFQVLVTASSVLERRKVSHQFFPTIFTAIIGASLFVCAESTSDTNLLVALITASLLHSYNSYQWISKLWLCPGNFKFIADILRVFAFLGFYHNQNRLFATLLFESIFLHFIFSVIVHDVSGTDQLAFAEPADLKYVPEEYGTHNPVRGHPELKEEMNQSEIVKQTNFIDVLVCGCGPTGLTMANELGIRNLTCWAIDLRTDMPSDPRYFNLTGRTMEGLNRLGVAEKVFAKSMPQDFGYGSSCATGMTHKDSVVIATNLGLSRADQIKLGYDMTTETSSRVFGSKWAEQKSQRCMQGTHEECLREKAEEYPHVQVMYGWELLSFYEDNVTAKNSSDKHDEHRVYAKIRNVRDHNDIRYVRSQYLTGCDGPGSFVSSTLKSKFDGFVTLGQTRTTHFHAPKLLDVVRPRMGEAFQYHISRPGFGVGWFVMNDPIIGAWTFNLVAMFDGRFPKDISTEEMPSILKEFIGPDIEFTILCDAPWYWNMFMARKYVQGRMMLCGDAAHSWPPFGGLGGNTGFGDANNLGWKLSGVIKGFLNRSVLHSYDFERRDAGLRVIMTVASFIPSRNALINLAKIVHYPFLWWPFISKWRFSGTGAHSGNHFMSEGIQMGIRYMSPILFKSTAHNEVDPVESSVNVYEPVLLTGAHILHLVIENKFISSFIKADGYTLLVVNSQTMTDKKKSAVEELKKLFAQRQIPLEIVNIEKELQRIVREHRPTDGEYIVASLYLRHNLILVRPDLFVAWMHAKRSEASASIFSGSLYNRENHIVPESDLVNVLAAVSGDIVDNETWQRSKARAGWLTNRFINGIQGYQRSHPTAIYVENEDKATVMKTILKSIRNKKNVSANATKEVEDTSVFFNSKMKRLEK